MSAPAHSVFIPAAVIGEDVAMLEAQIEIAKIAMMSATTRVAQVKAWAMMRTLIGRRSPAQVAQMERERGLRDA